jgi:hypothetical protein
MFLIIIQLLVAVKLQHKSLAVGKLQIGLGSFIPQIEQLFLQIRA